ncbi:hypothetical protein C1701_15030 [Actinoalloteichus sp. AHMU CJ021]|uniref:HAD family hydrolase n=1 Tax=Actinoalloteichus sp. AHMU CJ021 TaxID=2072503 RepID=UPI000CA04D88|nr:hypothetical protein C1701_15030 [Actinoalloteichus sp. AHMU CJ021]
MADLQAVVFDWRGTLVTTLNSEQWVREALRLLGRDQGAASVAAVHGAIERAAGNPNRLEAAGVDSDKGLHHDTYYSVFSEAGLDAELADALYTVESDPAYNHFADDVAETLHAVSARGCGVAILSDIHFDLRPVFAEAGLDRFVNAFVLSFERGMQKPQLAMFRSALDELGTEPRRTLMVGDRASYDGVAVELGMPTMLVPPLTDARQRRLHHVRNLVGSVPTSS